MACFGTVQLAKSILSGRQALLCLLVCWLLRPGITQGAGPPPVIDLQPLSQIVPKGASATFLVSAVSVTTMSYQWRVNGRAISGATQMSYTVTKAIMDAVYCVEVINAAGSVLSSNATLHVVRPPEADDDKYTTLMDHPLSVPASGVLANDTDPANEPLIAVLISGPTHGSLLLNLDGSFSYEPAPGYFGKDSFKYRAMNSLVLSDVMTVSLTVFNPRPLVFTSGAMTAQGFRLQLLGPAPATYLIEVSSDLQNWSPIATNAVVSGTLELLDAAALNDPVRFYRGRAQN